jgi:hypothetical protein
MAWLADDQISACFVKLSLVGFVRVWLESLGNWRKGGPDDDEIYSNK